MATTIQPMNGFGAQLPLTASNQRWVVTTTAPAMTQPSPALPQAQTQFQQPIPPPSSTNLPTNTKHIIQCANFITIVPPSKRTPSNLSKDLEELAMVAKGTSRLGFNPEKHFLQSFPPHSVDPSSPFFVENQPHAALYGLKQSLVVAPCQDAPDGTGKTMVFVKMTGFYFHDLTSVPNFQYHPTNHVFIESGQVDGEDFTNTVEACEYIVTFHSSLPIQLPVISPQPTIISYEILPTLITINAIAPSGRKALIYTALLNQTYFEHKQNLKTQEENAHLIALIQNTSPNGSSNIPSRTKDYSYGVTRIFLDYNPRFNSSWGVVSSKHRTVKSVRFETNIEQIRVQPAQIFDLETNSMKPFQWITAHRVAQVYPIISSLCTASDLHNDMQLTTKIYSFKLRNLSIASYSTSITKDARYYADYSHLMY